MGRERDRHRRVVVANGGGRSEVKRKHVIPVSICAAVLILGFASLDQYGVSWDDALGDLFFGERYLSFLTSFDAAYLDTSRNPYPPERTPNLFGSPFRVKPWEYYPVSNILGAATSAVLSRRLGLLDPFDGFHALNLLLAIPFVFALFAWMRRATGDLAAASAVLLLLLSPRIVCDLMANIKDFPEMVFFSLALLAFHTGWERGSTRWILGSGALWGLALGTKANALFVPVVVGAFLLFAPRAKPDDTRPARLSRGRLAIALVAAGAIGFALTVALWPYLWSDPVGRFAQNLRYIANQKFQVRAESVAEPLQQILLTTPIPFLLLFAAGLVPLARRLRSREPFAILVAAWLAIVAGRLYLPNAVNFDGVRHFLELFPPMAAVGGLGAAWVASAASRVAGAPLARVAPVAIVAALLGSCAFSLARSHPFEIAYWNAFAGGLEGAQARRIPQACDYWALSYRVALRWINENAPPGAVLAVPIAEHSVRLTAREWLRSDVTLAFDMLDGRLPADPRWPINSPNALTSPVAPDIDPARLELLRRVARERPVFVMLVPREDWSNALIDECRERHPLAAEWRRGGAPVVQIFRFLG
ncbi:MAG: glycosyltransferase family 39 protein [bacterium]